MITKIKKTIYNRYSTLSFRSKMILGLICVVFIPFIITGGIIYIKLSASLTLISQEKSAQIAKDIAILLDSALSEELKTISTIAANSEIINSVNSGDYKVARRELYNLYKISGNNYISFIIINRRGIVKIEAVSGARIGLDLSDRLYFIRARSGEATISGPLIARGPASAEGTGTPIIVLCAPIHQGNRFIGAIIATHKLSAIEKIISVIRMGRTGYVFITDSNGLIIIHPDKKYLLHTNIHNEPGMESLSDKIKKSKTGTVLYSLKNTEKIAGYALSQITGWNIIFSQTRAEVLRPGKVTLLSMLAITCIFILVTVIAIIMFAETISSPVQKMMEILKQITVNSTELIIGIGLDRRIMFSNPTAQQFFGKSEKELNGTPPLMVDPSDSRYEEIWAEIEKGIPWSGRIVYRKNDLSEATFSIILVAVKDSRGVIRHYLEIGKDITEELAYEKKIQQAQKMEAIGTMAGGIAHDFNNILTGIFSYTELSLTVKDDPPRTEKYLREILKAAERARDLIKQILTFSRITDIQFQPVLIKSIIPETVKLLRASTPAIIKIESCLKSDNTIMADPTQIHQVMVNLCTNAVHAIGMKPGTIRIELEDFLADEEFIKSHPGLNTGRHILLKISDTGSGISPEVLEHIFEPFFTTKGQAEGTGLGLSVVHGIIKKLNGSISVYSEQGRGTVFTIIIPSFATNDNFQGEPEPVIKRGNERIMLIDDEQQIISSMTTILTNLGYMVSPFTDSTKALAEFNANPDIYDLVISDFSMPRLHGFDFIEKIRKTRAGIPVIIVSGYIAPDIEEKAKDSGIQVILRKPLTTTQMSDSIRKVLAAT